MLLALLPTETMAGKLLAVMCTLNDKLDNMLREGGRVKRVSNQGACLCCTPGRALMEMWAGDSARMEPRCAFAPVAALACSARGTCAARHLHAATPTREAGWCCSRAPFATCLWLIQQPGTEDCAAWNILHGTCKAGREIPWKELEQHPPWQPSPSP